MTAEILAKDRCQLANYMLPPPCWQLGALSRAGSERPSLFLEG